MQMETEALSAVIAEKDAALADANDSIHDLKNDLNDLLDNRSALESKIKELIASTERIEEFYKSQVSTVKEELENRKKVLDVANEEIDVLNDALSKEKSLNETLRGDIALKVLEKEELQSKVDDLTAVKAKHEAAIAKAAADIAIAGITLEKLQDEITGHVEHEAKLQSEIVTLTDLKYDNEASLAKAAADIEDATKTLQKLQGEINGHVEREGKLQSEIVTLTVSKAKHEAALVKASDEAAALNTKIEELQDEIISQYNGHVEEKANMKSEFEKLSAIRAEKVAALATAAVDIESLEKEIEENRVSISSLLEKLDTATEEIGRMQDAEEEMNTKLDEAKAASIAFLDDNAGLEADINELVKSVESLKEEKFVAGELICIQSKEMEELKMAVENAKELATKSQNAEMELKSMLDEELKASEALKEEMTKLQSSAQNCEDLKASIDFLTESNAALTKTVDDLQLERSGADANVKTLKKDLKKALKVIAKLESNEKKLIEHVLASAQVTASPAVQTPPRVLPPSPNGVECVPFTPPKSSKKHANLPLPDNGSVAAPPSPPHLTRQAMMNPPSTKKASIVSAFPAENLLFHQEAEGINAQGNELMQKKKFSEALASFTTALTLSPDGPNSHIYYTSRAAAYCQLGQYADAAEDCRKSIELNDTYEEAYSRYGLCLFHLGDVKGSLAAQKKSFDLARNAYRSDLSTLG
jgi:chromosome segregation ATPase